MNLFGQSNSPQGPGDPVSGAPDASAPVPLPPDVVIILPVRNAVLFPGLIVPLGIGRPKSIAAVQQAVREERPIGIVMQRDPEAADPGPADLHRIGTVANILRCITAPDGIAPCRLPGRAAFPRPGLSPGRPFMRRGSCISRAGDPRAGDRGALAAPQSQALEALQLLPQVPQGLVGTVQATTSAADARRPRRRLPGHQAGGEAGDPGDGGPVGAARQGLAPAGGAASRCCA